MFAFTVLVGSGLLLAQVDDPLAGATARLDAGDARGAARLLDALISSAAFSSLGPDAQAQAWALKGAAAEAMEDPETARTSYGSSLEASQGASRGPWIGEAVLGLTRSALTMKNGANARLALEKLDPVARASEPALSLAARASFLEGRAREAEAQLLECARAAPSAETEYLLGVILFDRGDRAQALARFDTATRLDPSDYYSGIYRVRTLLELNRPEDALKSLDAMDATADTAEIRYLRGKSQLRLGRLAPAAQSLQRALELNSAYGEALFGLGTALRQAGKADEARETLRRFEQVHRADADRLRALDRMSQGLLREPNNVKLAEDLALANFESGDLEAAERYSWRALEHDPLSRKARLVLARAFARLGRFGAAALHYQRILRTDPADAEARKELTAIVEKHARREK